MTMFPVATGARLLGIHPKTLHHWLTAAEFPLAAHPTSLVDLLQQLAHLHTQVATLQQHLTMLALAVLPERSERSAHCLRPLEELVSQPLESLQAPQQTEVAGPLAPAPRPAPRPLPVEVRARSRVSRLPQRAAHPLLGCPTLVSWTRLVALSGSHRPLNARLVGTGGSRSSSSGGRALKN